LVLGGDLTPGSLSPGLEPILCDVNDGSSQTFACVYNIYRRNCSHDRKDAQAAGKLSVFKSDNLTAPSAVVIGTAQFSQLGTYVALTSYRDNDVIVASSTAAGTVDSSSAVFALGNFCK